MSVALSPESFRITLNDVKPEEAVEKTIGHAAELGVSDLFLVTNENHVSVAARHLGIVQLFSILPLELGRRCIAHIKANAGMDISEKRKPLDGRWIFARDKAAPLDLRISTLPTMHGEDMALRMLDRQTRFLKPEELGLFRNDYNQLLSLLNSPSGLVLVTGPTGSGKTTTLYACLSYLNNGQRKINTIEDPIEYALDGVRQSQVHMRINVGFVELLRSVLRQAPDVIMIGEVRDPETAEIVVRAANSGHLVLATLHAQLAAGAVQSLLSLGVHPHFLASSLRGVIAQRLVRTLCPTCRVGFDVGDASRTFEDVRAWLEPGQGWSLFGPSGCAKCHSLGYDGRTGVFEVLPVSRELRHLIMERTPMQTIRAKGVEQGMVEFRRSALLKVAQGLTSIEEVHRCIPVEYLNIDE